MVIILTRAGLGLDAGVLKKHYVAVLQLGLLPWVVECLAIAVTTYFLLGLPWMWGELLTMITIYFNSFVIYTL